MHFAATSSKAVKLVVAEEDDSNKLVSNLSDRPRPDRDRGSIEEGVDKLKMIFREAYACAHGWAPGVLRIVAS
jgi:hypothetical protein